MSDGILALRTLIVSLQNEKMAGARRALASEALSLLRAVADALPPADSKEAEQRGYQRGMLDAVKLLHETRREHEEPLRRANVGSAGTVLNGVWNYGQYLCSEAERRFTQAALLGGIGEVE